MRIALIEDNASLRKVLAALFKSCGHEVVAELAGGRGAAERIAALKPDVLCLDYHLPGQDGLAILKSLQAAAPEIAVIFMTASADAGLEALAADAGASGLIRKPLSQDQIVPAPSTTPTGWVSTTEYVPALSPTNDHFPSDTVTS